MFSCQVREISGGSSERICNARVIVIHLLTSRL